MVFDSDNDKIKMVPGLTSKVLQSVPDKYRVRTLPNMNEMSCLNLCFFETAELKSCFYNTATNSCVVTDGTAFLLVDNKIPTNDPVNGLRKKYESNFSSIVYYYTLSSFFLS